MSKPHTRKQYLDGDCTHTQYYLNIAQEIGLSFAESSNLPRICAALEKGDEHLNTIPLGEWDAHGASLCAHQESRLATAFKARGDYITQAGLVSLLKTAAKHAAQKGVSG